MPYSPLKEKALGVLRLHVISENDVRFRDEALIHNQIKAAAVISEFSVRFQSLPPATLPHQICPVPDSQGPSLTKLHKEIQPKRGQGFNYAATRPG